MIDLTTVAAINNQQDGFRTWVELFENLQVEVAEFMKTEFPTQPNRAQYVANLMELAAECMVGAEKNGDDYGSPRG